MLILFPLQHKVKETPFEHIWSAKKAAGEQFG